MASPSAKGRRPIATLVTVPAANHSEAGMQRCPSPRVIRTSARNALTAALTMATAQIPNVAPSTGNRAP